MDIKELEIVLDESINAPDDEELKAKYADNMTRYLKDHKSSDELVTIVVKGMDIDRGCNYLDYVAAIPKGEIQSVWKQIRDNKEVANNTDHNGLKLICALLSLAILKEGSIEGYAGSIIAKMVSVIFDARNPIPHSIYATIILDFFVEDVYKAKYPNFDTFKMSGDTIKKFAQMLLDITDKEDKEEKYKGIRQWAANGARMAEKKIEKEKIEARIPKSKIDDLMAIVEHYKAVEKQVRDGVYEVVRLEGVIKGLQEEIGRLNGEKSSLQSNISSLNNNIEELKKALKKAEDEVQARIDINDAFSAIKDNDEKGILRDIAEDLKLTYKQMKGSEDNEMSVELGEIYREMLKRIFKALDKKGIRME